MRRALIDWAAAREAYESARQWGDVAAARISLEVAADALRNIAHALLAAERSRIASLSAEVRAQSSELAALLADDAAPPSTQRSAE